MLNLLCFLRCAAALALGLQLVNTADAAGPEWLYAVNPGDTLISIAAGYLTNPNDWRQLQKLNYVAEPKRLIPGTKLRLPAALLKREAVIAEVIHVQGKVTHTPKNDRPQNLIAGARLEVGDMIETSADASVSMRFVDGSRLLLTQNTQVSLAEMILFGKTGMAKTVIELNRGSLDTRVAEQQKPSARYEIKSRALNLAVRGTDFRAHVSDTDQVTRSEVLDGAVQASGTSGEAVAVLAGFGTLAALKESPRAPQALLSAPDLSLVPSVFQRVPLLFEWSATVGAERYHAQVFANRSFERLLLDGVFQGNAAKWPDLPDGRYVLRVRSIDSNGLEGANADQEFMLKARPEPPFISAPHDGQKVYGPQATLRWSVPNAVQFYHLQLAAKPDFSELLVDLPTQVKNEHMVSLAPGQYYWRIASVAAGQDQGPFSDVQSFTQRKAPESPQLEPPQIDDKRLLFHWRSGEAGEKFQVQVARDPDFAQPIMDSVVNINQSQIDSPKPGTYYMRVNTIDADGFAGPFGPIQQIEVPNKINWWLLLLLVPFGL
jgi:hypothetical protein